MAINLRKKFADFQTLSEAATHPSTPASGDPVIIGVMSGVALTDEGDGQNPSTHTTICTQGASFMLSVKGENAGGNSPVAIGDALFYNSGDTPVLNKKVAGVLFGYALGTVTSGATATIEVKLAAK